MFSRITLSVSFFFILSAIPLISHAVLVKSTPSPNSAVEKSPFRLELKFNSRVDGPRSQISIVGPDHELHEVKLEKQTQPDLLTATVVPHESGVYRVRWQVLAADGHITRGEFVITVK